MNNEIMSVNEFLSVCLESEVSELDMCLFANRVTNNFKISMVDILLSDINRCFLNIVLIDFKSLESFVLDENVWYTDEDINILRDGIIDELKYIDGVDEKLYYIYNNKKAIISGNWWNVANLCKIISKNTAKSNTTRNKKSLTFTKLFVDDYIKIIPSLKKAIVYYGYVMEDANLRNLAKIYYWLKKDKRCIIDVDDTSGLTCFFREFKIELYTTTKPNTENRKGTVRDVRGAEPSPDEKKEYESKFSRVFQEK